MRFIAIICLCFALKGKAQYYVMAAPNVAFNTPLNDTKNLLRNYNVYKDGDYLRWELTQNKYALFDTQDFDALLQKEWRAAKARKTFYPVSGKDQLLFAHNYLIGGILELITVDHKSMNGLDNRRSNLRLATRQQQMLNRSIIGLSGFRV